MELVVELVASAHSVDLCVEFAHIRRQHDTKGTLKFIHSLRARSWRNRDALQRPLLAKSLNNFSQRHAPFRSPVFIRCRSKMGIVRRPFYVIDESLPPRIHSRSVETG